MKTTDIDYLIKYPNGYAESKKYPVIVWLHGAGSRGSDINILKTSALYRYAAQNAGFEFITVYPHCKEKTWFDIYEQLIKFLKKLQNQKFADTSRIYLCGASMGGYASYQVLMSLPDFFAAAAICCGGGMYWNGGSIKTPVSIYHGKDDSVVYPLESVNMFNAITKSGTTARLKLFENTAHNCWDTVFLDDDVYGFLLSNNLER